MAKRRGNPNWGKPEPIGPVVPTVTSFEQVVKEFKLTPDQYIRSTRLREWARRNKNSLKFMKRLKRPDSSCTRITDMWQPPSCWTGDESRRSASVTG